MSWNDVTIIPSLLFSVSRFCTPPEVKFHVFGPSKHGEEKSLSNNFFFILISTLWRFYRGNKKKICHIHFKHWAESQSMLWFVGWWLYSKAIGLLATPFLARLCSVSIVLGFHQCRTMPGSRSFWFCKLLSACLLFKRMLLASFADRNLSTLRLSSRISLH